MKYCKVFMFTQSGETAFVHNIVPYITSTPAFAIIIIVCRIGIGIAQYPPSLDQQEGILYHFFAALYNNVCRLFLCLMLYVYIYIYIYYFSFILSLQFFFFFTLVSDISRILKTIITGHVI